ncbi:MAG: helix-turn-helix transcriptional regulator [Jatrophihabitans sp.]|uniref:helix-turn-helix transcriptional regulator n=1 Tax=Jatrophihabitans sp. TaxID=1932789 RepID=UPI003F80D6F4
MTDELLDITTAAHALGVPIATLRWWRHTGIGPHSFKIGRHAKYRRIDIDAWLEQQLRNSRDGDGTAGTGNGAT